MKQSILLTVIVLLMITVSASAQSNNETYYVTIGVFGVKNFAAASADRAVKNNLKAVYALNAERNLYYVYILTSADKSTAIASMLKTRVETDYKDAWVFKGMLGGNGEIVAVEKPKEEIRKEEPKQEQIPVAKVIKEEPLPPAKDSTGMIVVIPSDSAAAKTVVVAEVPAVTPVVTEPVVKPVGTPFFFKLTNAAGAPIIGEVHVQETSKAAQYQAFRGNEIVYIKSPVNAAGTYIIVTQAPGYQQIKETIVYKEPAGISKGASNEFIIPLELKRAKHGDYIDFNNVRFIRNSSIMMTESQAELDGLTLLMKENPKYKIKIHGHCNGKSEREITLRGTSPQFFAIDPSKNKKVTASAMRLSEERANSVRDYIISQGIDGSRIATKGEGAKIPLYGPTSTLAGYNDRVEVEIKKN